MGVDDEYKMVSAQDEANDHLLEQSAAISRASYRKRNMFASILVGAVIGAAAMFLVSLLFAPQGYSVTKSAPAATTTAAAEKVEVAPSTVTVTQTATIPGGTRIPQVGVDKAHIIPAGTILDCGSNPAEARAKDCVYDVMMQDWMPRPCYDEKLSERYLATGNWTWWLDVEATKSLTLEEMRKGEHGVIFVIQDYHKSHCIFAWEKATRAIRNEWPLIEELVSYDHIMHCRHSTLSKESENVRGVRAPTAYVRCALYDDWIGHFPANSEDSIAKRDPAAKWTLF
ncbi:hypothetical protein Dsin_033214 [Dipteronia sinensis]|uniref:Uncharacterized protein n=1 Tax=Dipteronia sinensis TaxID=43782 RepID=A0AAE0DPC8_9ROSI|nr:hypothetical protein Dsin_033214 [Dipteronia sinensis]